MNMESFTATSDDIARKYREILLDYLASPKEQDRNAVFDVGYEAAVRRFNLQEIIQLHHEVLMDLFAGTKLAKETVRLAGELLQEVTRIYGLLYLRCSEPG